MSAVTQQTLHYWLFNVALDEARNPDVVRPQMFLAVPLRPGPKPLVVQRSMLRPRT